MSKSTKSASSAKAAKAAKAKSAAATKAAKAAAKAAAAEAKAAEVKAAEAAPAAEAAEAEVNPFANLVNYKPTNPEKPQVVVKWGKDGLSRRARACYHLSCFLIANKGLDKFNAREVHTEAQRITGINFESLYGKAYPDSPVHQGMHAISKGETKEIIEKDGVLIDSFARGARKLVLKDRVVGLSHDNSYYHKNPDLDYPMQNEQELHALLINGLRETLPKSKLERI